MAEKLSLSQFGTDFVIKKENIKKTKQYEKQTF